MLETNRLLLRPHSLEEAPGYAALWSNPAPEVPGLPAMMTFGAEDSWSRLLRFIGHWSVFGFGPFVVIDKASGDTIGEVGFAHFRRGNGADFDDAPEAMWKIDRGYNGKGLALEAVQAAAGWFDARGIAARSVCMIHPANTGSLKIAAHAGFRQFRQSTYRDNPMLLLERTAA